MWNDRRKEYRRFHDYFLEIEGELENGEKFHEMVSLVDVSEGGAQFTTLCKGHYFLEQTLQACFFVSAARETKGQTMMTARVVRIEVERENAPQNDEVPANVAIAFSDPFPLKP